MKRRELREQVFRLLFRVSFHTEEDMKEQMLLWAEDLPAEDTQEAFKEKDIDYITTRCGKVLEKVAQIDPIINENTEGWNTERMGKVELSVLRLAVYEILFDEDIPASVAINEAVEIAKKYGQESSGAFVNAILGKVAKSDESKS
ncbi:MAG: transcription antitermination factor NusB [Lachnospiraceae bacterium]|nr:transcription antitermination factor NusB [Lachnospiraceae bacterium]